MTAVFEVFIFLNLVAATLAAIAFVARLAGRNFEIGRQEARDARSRRESALE